MNPQENTQQNTQQNPNQNNYSGNGQNSGSNAQSQILSKIRSATNILITVSNNPSVDQLCSLLGLTLVLHNLDKHSTAVYSGDTPPALEFLEPGKTLEKNVDSLRDLIISLDKSKADKLHYKPEGDFVKIYITPYRTKIDQNDLTFEQGDYNVELVIALGVSSRDDIDQAIAAHGKILHDATVVTISSGQQTSEFGSINWSNRSSSSLAEMMTALVQDLGKDLLDTAVSTAFLTGIVAETDRFSNAKTTPQVMTLSAKLMAQGANQQLISTQLSSNLGSVSFSTPEPEQASIELDHTPDVVAEAGEYKDPTELNLSHDEAVENEPVREEVLSAPESQNPEEQALMPDPAFIERHDDASANQSFEEPATELPPTLDVEQFDSQQVPEFAPVESAMSVSTQEQAVVDMPKPAAFEPIPVDQTDLEQLLRPAAPVQAEGQQLGVTTAAQAPALKTSDIQMPTPTVAPTPFDFVPIKTSSEEQKIVGKVIDPSASMIKRDHPRAFMGGEHVAPTPVDFEESASGQSQNNIGFLGRGNSAKSEEMSPPPPPTNFTVPSPWSPPTVDLSPVTQPANNPADPVVKPNTFKFPTPAPAEEIKPQAPQTGPSGDISLPPPLAPPPMPM
jgi:nanoRNase/pAp phosphatase (c-di-AMP/oligoRNAs hydrolase)